MTLFCVVHLVILIEVCGWGRGEGRGGKYRSTSMAVLSPVSKADSHIEEEEYEKEDKDEQEKITRKKKKKKNGSRRKVKERKKELGPSH